jgi:hypothetical protein
MKLRTSEPLVDSNAIRFKTIAMALVRALKRKGGCLAHYYAEAMKPFITISQERRERRQSRLAAIHLLGAAST